MRLEQPVSADCPALPVAAIASRLGHESDEAFSRAFKHAHEMAPSL
jgi:AraC-like DNA-binding protein